AAGTGPAASAIRSVSDTTPATFPSSSMTGKPLTRCWRNMAAISRYAVPGRTVTTSAVMMSLTYACMVQASPTAAEPGRDVSHFCRCQRSRTLDPLEPWAEVRPVSGGTGPRKPTGSTVLACDEADSTGELTVAFYGRAHIAGLKPGTQVRLHG